MAVVTVVAGSIYASADQGSPESFIPAVAGGPSLVPDNSQYVFQNGSQAIDVLVANGSVEIAADVTFRTRGTRWALVSHVPGEQPLEPFGWRATVGNDNVGDGTSLGIQSHQGVGEAKLVNSVFNNQKVATVVYTSGKKAWYAKVYRLGGIRGWVESSVVLTGAKSATQIPGPKGDDVAAFGYDAAGKLLVQFPDNAKNPLP
jgi:hypothetical protein